MNTSQKLFTVLAGLTLFAGATFAQRVEESGLTLDGAWTPTNDANASGGTYTVSSIGGKVSFDVPGASFVLYRKVDANGGAADITVGGKPFGQISFYFQETRWQVPAVIDLEEFGPGPHKIVLTGTNFKPSGSAGTNVYIDVIEAPAPFAPSPAQQAALDRLNAIRTQAGLPPARQVAAINLAAQAHADYLVRNNIFLSHNQTPGTQGFLGVSFGNRLQYFGYDRGGSENAGIAEDGAKGVDDLLATIYHRIPLLRHAFTEIGTGVNDGKVVQNYGSRFTRQPPAARLLTNYPADNQTQVPIVFQDESPEPLPGKPRPMGYPISLHITQPEAVAGRGNDTTPFTATLRGPDGNEIPVYLVSSANDTQLSNSDFFMMPQAPLAINTTYTARMAGADSLGNAFAKEWKFTTVQPGTITNIFKSQQGSNYVIQFSTAGPVASAKLEYGPTQALGQEQQLNPTFSDFTKAYTALAKIPNITPGTYYYRISSIDLEGKTYSTAILTFVIPGAAPAPNPNPAPTPGAGPERLSPGQQLLPNNQLLSPNKAFRLLYQSDGNLVLYRVSNNEVMWATNTPGRLASRVVMQADGNLVMYGLDNNAQWHSNTFGPGRENSTLLLRDDGKAVIVDSSGQTVWENGQAAPTQVTPPERSKLIPGASLLAGQSLFSANRTYQLIYQTDGNLVVYKDGAAVWASNTMGKAPGRVCMQVDGNLVMYGPDGTAHWATGTNTAANTYSELVMQTDGNLVIYNPNGAAVWSIR